MPSRVAVPAPTSIYSYIRLPTPNRTLQIQISCWCSHKSVEDSPHRSHASRSQLGVLLEVKMLSDCAPVEVVGVEEDLGADLHLTRHIPDEAGELPSDGDADFVLRKLSPHCKTPPAFRQAQLRFPGDLTDDLRLSFLANLEASGDLRFEAIIPRGLHQDTSGVFIARFGDLALATGLACGELRGHQSEVRHQRTRMSKAGQIAHLGDEGDGGDEVKALQTHQRFDHGIHAPILALHSQCLGDPFDSFASLLRGQSIFVKGELLRRMFEADRGQVSIVRLGPGTFSLIVAPMAQHHRLHLQANSRSVRYTHLLERG